MIVKRLCILSTTSLLQIPDPIFKAAQRGGVVPKTQK
jgi:hypothetical protein